MTLLDSKLQTDYSQGATTYTASGAERVLVINAETYNIGGGGTNTSRANTTVSGTEISNEINVSSATGTNRDAQIRATLADLASADTVQCSNRPQTNRGGQIHILFSADEIQSVTNVAYQTYTDANNNHQYQYTAASDATLLCVCWNENNYNQQTSASIAHSGSYTTIYENTWSSSPNSLCIGLYDVSAGDVITMSGSASSTAYGTQLYAVYEVAKQGDDAEIDYTGSEYVYTCRTEGNYLLECWGAQGGTSGSYRGGYGGYSCGVVHLSVGDTLYVNVGGKGTDGVPRTAAPGGYNGGGNGVPFTTDNANYASGGGGCTHIAKTSGELKDLDPVDDLADILIVAGGGGGGYYHTNGANFSAPGGDGGGYIGGTNWNGNTGYAGGGGGTQSAGGAAGTSGAPGGFGYGGTSSTYSAGGGGGYYGGGAANHRGTGAGSGYIGNGVLSAKRMVTYSTQTSPDPSTYTEQTTNASGTATADYAKTGNGYAKITLIVSSTKYLLRDGNSAIWTISGGTLTQVTGTLNAQLFADYGMTSIPSWSDYSSLTNPTLLCWNDEELIDMVATTTGLPSPQAIISEGISLIVQGTDGIDHIDVTDSGSPEYAFSVDGGTTWKIWSGTAWVTSSGTDMSGADVEALTNTEWASLTSGASAIKIRFTLGAAADGVAAVEVFYKQL